LLHEEIELKWEDVMNYVKDFQALQKYRSDMFVGVVSTKYLLELNLNISECIIIL